MGQPAGLTIQRGTLEMKAMCENQVGEFLNFLSKRIDWHYEKITNTLAHHRTLIKIEKAEAEVILNTFVEILNAEK
jgi:hypothetical protein